MGERGENSFGTKLRQLRQAAGMTQEELAERAGLTAKGIGALERGERRRPYPHTVRALASALGLSVDHLTELVSALPPRASEPPVANGPASSSLPVLPSALVGREQDIASVIECLTGENRLLTLTGLGGVGKTSLAVECGHRLQSRFPGGVAFVPLAQLTDPGLFLESVVQALGLRDAAGRSLRDVLVAALQDRQMLVILDNFEQILPAATDVADLLVRKGMPFRECHGVVAGLVKRAVDSGRTLTELTLEEIRAQSELLDEEYYEVLRGDRWLESKDSEGGTSLRRVREQLTRARALLD